MNQQIFNALEKTWFKEAGAYVLVDGQYGSTGKGAVAGALAECFWDRVHVVISNAGPNSGHTSYWGEEKIVLKQLPTFSVIAGKVSGGRDSTLTYLSAGAVVDPHLLARERTQYGITNLHVHPSAARVDDACKHEDQVNVVNIAGTGQGVGPALMRKLRRLPQAVYGSATYRNRLFMHNHMVCFLEVPQGFSLGINSGFYPHVTTRECTVSQALADAGMPPSFHRKTIMTVRTFPIRVGNTGNSSGPMYPDQIETNWEALSRAPEMTTVTQRVRRVFTWSRLQFAESLRTNDPDVIALTFCDYLQPGTVHTFVKENILAPYRFELGRYPEAVILSFGPKSSDMVVWGA